MNKHIKRSTVEASEWFAAQCEGELSRADRERFLGWLRESPAHVEEYLELARLWDEMAEVDALQQVDVDSELAKARNTVAELGNVGGTAAETSRAGAARWRNAGLSVAAGLLAAVMMAWWADVFDGPANAAVATAIGEQRSMTLDDGSVVSLNTQTSVRVRFAAGERRVELLEGEALFDITRDEQRPFVVVAGTTEVRVLGTTFNVYRKDDQTATVTVLEGRVAVTRADAPGSAIPQEAATAVELTRGQQARIRAGGAVVEPAVVNLEKAVAWTDRRLIFENTRLEDVLTEFNRYNAQKLSVSDPTLAALRLNGVFESHDPDSLLQYLERAHAVHVRVDGSRRILEPR